MSLHVPVLQAVVNEDTTADAALLQTENARLRRELNMFRHLHQVGDPPLGPPVQSSVWPQTNLCYCGVKTGVTKPVLGTSYPPIPKQRTVPCWKHVTMSIDSGFG